MDGFAFVAHVLVFVVPRCHATPIFGVCKIAKNKPRQFTTLGNCRGLFFALMILLNRGSFPVTRL
jgi:hypothetical protein